MIEPCAAVRASTQLSHRVAKVTVPFADSPSGVAVCGSGGAGGSLPGVHRFAVTGRTCLVSSRCLPSGGGGKRPGWSDVKRGVSPGGGFGDDNGHADVGDQGVVSGYTLGS